MEQQIGIDYVQTEDSSLVNTDCVPPQDMDIYDLWSSQSFSDLLADIPLPLDEIIPSTEQFMNTTSIIPWVNDTVSAFVDWRSYRPPVPPLQRRESESLHKRCLNFLNCINSHKISTVLTENGGNPKETYKGSTRHANAERKRRGNMKDAFSALRELLPMNPKVVQKSKLTVLLEAVDYICDLKGRVEHLENRNEELEGLCHLHPES
ncbi:hypothetical protein SUGI_0470610 [Cryptomeria japonica]|nr:hypothetical protein SUGI_0470610 [Cryptomeria japonica]